MTYHFIRNGQERQEMELSPIEELIVECAQIKLKITADDCCGKRVHKSTVAVWWHTLIVPTRAFWIQ